MALWIARDGDGTLVLYFRKPKWSKRDDSFLMATAHEDQCVEIPDWIIAGEVKRRECKQAKIMAGKVADIGSQLTGLTSALRARDAENARLREALGLMVERVHDAWEEVDGVGWNDGDDVMMEQARVALNRSNGCPSDAANI